jgi:diaminohydroxyphosphoribosylaminopyrimidine deaminase/5-amino-6-(5-phosphoribosylamino)uracil reductase
MMRRALSLAARAAGATNPNPMVGAVIVKNGVIAGEGWHEKAGEAHAEVNAIREAGARAKGADLYVTLEPCSTTGRTPPCTDAIIKAGIKRVFAGMADPNPRHKGAGFKILNKAGIHTECGTEHEKCAELNAAFIKWIVTKTPFVTLKMAMTLDGKIATAAGESKWVTGPLARRRVHELRRLADAVMVGGGTVRADRPSLTVRDVKCSRQPRRVIVSQSLTEAKLLKLMPAGEKPELFSPQKTADWTDFMKKLGSENATSVLIEGGGETAWSALSAGVVDRVEFHIAPKILGGKNSVPVVGGAGFGSLAGAFGLTRVSVKTFGPDICVSGWAPDSAKLIFGAVCPAGN